MDNTSLSRLIARSFESTRSLKISSHISSIDDIKDAVRAGSIQGAVYIPAGLEREIKLGKPATIVIYNNTSNIIIGNLILKDASTISGTISAGVLMNKLEAGGLSNEQALTLANPIRVESHSLFNPAYNYSNFLSPAVVMVLLQMVIQILAVVVINDEINNGTPNRTVCGRQRKSLGCVMGQDTGACDNSQCHRIGCSGNYVPAFRNPNPWLNSSGDSFHDTFHCRQFSSGIDYLLPVLKQVPSRPMSPHFTIRPLFFSAVIPFRCGQCRGCTMHTHSCFRLHTS